MEIPRLLCHVISGLQDTSQVINGRRLNYMINSGGFMLCINLHSPGQLHWHWGDHVIYLKYQKKNVEQTCGTKTETKEI